MKSRRIVFAAVAAAGLAAVAAAVVMNLSSKNQPGSRLTDDPRVLGQGQKVYLARCAACHGARLEGQANWRERGADGVLPAPPHDASGHTWHHPDDVLFRITKYGVAKVANISDYQSAMPAFEGVLTDDEITAVLSWIKAQWPADVRRQQEQITRDPMRQQRD